MTAYLRIAWHEDLRKHPWTEPPSDPGVHRASWAKALEDPRNQGMATDHPEQLIAWLKGRCARPHTARRADAVNSGPERERSPYRPNEELFPWWTHAPGSPPGPRTLSTCRGW
ncbi:hypothetical protein ACFVH6_03210 [Spirillospora sp. NPDC127200]